MEHDLPQVPSDDQQKLMEQMDTWIKYLQANPEADENASAFLDQAMALIVHHLLKNDFSSLGLWQKYLSRYDALLDRELPDATNAWESSLLHLHYLQKALAQVKQEAFPIEMAQRLQTEGHWLEQAVLRAVAAADGRLVRRQQVVERMYVPTGHEKPSDTRIGQILKALHLQDLLISMPVSAQGGLHPHYTLSPLGRRVLDTLPKPQRANNTLFPPIEETSSRFQAHG